VKTAHAVHGRAPADGEVRHVERLAGVVGILSSERQEVRRIDAERVLGVAAEVALDESRGKPVESRAHRRVRGEEIAGSRDGQRHVEGVATVDHEGAGTLEDGEGGMPLVEMADLGLDAKCA